MNEIAANGELGTYYFSSFLHFLFFYLYDVLKYCLFI